MMLLACTHSRAPADVPPADGGPSDSHVDWSVPTGGPGIALPVEPPAPTRAHVPWEPGDDIPGWEDFPCEDLGRPIFEAEYVYAWDVRISFGDCAHHRDCPTELPGFSAMSLGACEDDPSVNDSCEEGAASISFEGLRHGAPPEPRGQGWYQTLHEEACAQRERSAFVTLSGEGLGYSATTLCQWDGWYMDLPSRTWICLSRVRPDEIRGVAWALPLSFEQGGIAEDWEVGYHKTSFDILFPDHCGAEVDHYGGIPDHCKAVYFYSHYDPITSPTGGGYDHAWPWDKITDPIVRTEVYNRYLPYGRNYPPAEDSGASTE